MMRSLFAGVAGLRNHQTRMDVVGNNIANVNTVGFKASRVNFQDMLSQTLQGASSPQGNRGGTNPMQVGLGVGLASIDTMFTDGSFQPTGKATDLGIQGQGFFVLQDGASKIYTRAGSFDFDTLGNFLVPGTGYKVMGYLPDASGTITPTPGSEAAIQVPVGLQMQAKASTKIDLTGTNLEAMAPIGSTVSVTKKLYDSQGQIHEVTQTFVKESANTWLMGTAPITAGDTIDFSATSTPTLRLTFDTDGNLSSTDINAITATGNNPTFANTFQLDSTMSSQHSTTFTAFDSNHIPHVYKVTFTNTGATSWNYSVVDQANPTGSAVASGTVASAAGVYTFTPATFTPGGFTTPVSFGSPVTGVAPAAGSSDLTYATTGYTAGGTFKPLNLHSTATPATYTALSIDLALTGITQYSNTTDPNKVAASSVVATPDGYGTGVLTKKTIDPNGFVVGTFSNGQTQNLAQIALAVFNNPAGLDKVGNNMFIESNNSGAANIGAANSGGRGNFSPGSLEMANVDLAQEFSNMIITQRGFQANSKIITTTDQMLEELASLKR